MAYTQKQYAESDAVKKFRENMEAHGPYNSEWKPQIDSVRDSILNRKDFNYDVNGDALYQQYKDRYVNLGQQAMMDTMGQAAKLTGGYGNSNAQMVGQQAYQGYLQGLTDKIPELAQLAYQRYAQQGQDLYQKYGLLNTQEQADYNRWLAERDFLTNQYNTERGFDYGQYRDTVGDDQWKAQFDEDLRRFNFANQLGEFAPVEVPVVGGYDGGGSDSRNPGMSAYELTKEIVENGGHSNQDNFQIINQAPLTTSQKNTLVNTYTKPALQQAAREENKKNTTTKASASNRRQVK
jgi:hypothetical protein